MPDFKFSDEDAPITPQGTPSTPPAVPEPESLPEKPSEFGFFEGEKPAPPPKPAATPIPGPPIPKIAPPTVNNPTPAQSAPKAPARPGVPANAARPTPVPPSIALPQEAPAVRPIASARDQEGAPQDDFSFKIWSIGQNIKRGMDALETPLSWLLRVAIVIGVTALAYMIAGTFLGKAGNLEGNPNALALTRNLNVSAQAFMISLLVVAVSSILIGYEDNRLGFAVGIIGVLCHFIVPIALKKLVGDSAATAAMAVHFRHYGYFLVMIGLVKGVFDVAAWLWALPEKIKAKHANVGVANQAEAKQRIIARESNMFSPCWKLPFCRESIRKACPAFLAKKTCWKFGRGCYCDSEMISRIVRGESLDVIKAPTKQSTSGKPPCGRCYIYLEHQTYKFRMLSPLALPATVFLTWIAWPFYAKAFQVFNKGLDSVWDTLSFNSARLTPEALETSKESVKAIAETGARAEDVMLITQNMLGVVFGFLLLIYVSKFIEWAIFKAKL
jgi:hypothetical protein